MKKGFRRVGTWSVMVGGCLFQGCAFTSAILEQNVVDPDLVVAAWVSFLSDTAVFLLENAAASIL